MVTTAMLPTAVFAEMEKLSVWGALGKPMACEPKFLLAAVPVKLTCAPTDAGNRRHAEISRKRESAARRKGILAWMKSNFVIMKASLRSEGLHADRHDRGAIDAPSPSCCLTQNPVCGVYRRGHEGHNNPKLRGTISCGCLLDSFGCISMQRLTIAAACGHSVRIARMGSD